MNHILEDNTAEWDARVQAEEQRRDRNRAMLRHIGVSAGVLLVLVALALGFMLRPKHRPAGTAPASLSVNAALPTARPTPAELERQAQDLAVELARVWRNGKSAEASEAAHAFTVDYERAVRCDLRWIAGREGPGVWEQTVSLVRALEELTPYVGRARDGQAVVVTAVICPLDGEEAASAPGTR